MTSSEKIFRYLQDRLGKHIKILLIPYKRDMWDCLEGIYKIANNTEGCTAKVCPIPYTFRDSRGKPIKWFMDDWSVIESGLRVDFRKKPQNGEYDAILFHNPYDNANYVTSVHPSYYSDKLKGLSKLLCLVPYGIGSTVVLISPGVVNADIVFTENDYVVNEFKRQIREEGATEEEVEMIAHKFITFGSPKCDLNLDQQIPKEWERRIKGKKVVLITTSLMSFLDDPEGEMSRVHDVIDEYSKKDDCILIWREHPLMKPTILAMRSSYAREYIKYQRNYIKRNIGILDLTQDYRIAFSIADVLYSDPSSLTIIWQQTGKELHIMRGDKNE